MTSLGLKMSSRTYRDQFTNSYKVLYKQMDELYGSKAAYLPEILDSAQEAFDHLWVNGEKYVFSEHVVESGSVLYSHFTSLKDTIALFYQTHFEGKHQITDQTALLQDCNNMKGMLVRFDELWTEYEQKYVYELMVIESDARRFIIESINIEAVLG